MTKALGEGALTVMEVATGADALARAHGATRKKRLAVAKAPEEASALVAAPSEKADAQAEERKAPFKVATLRIWEEQFCALEDEAVKRRRKRGGGKADISEVAREAFELWMRSRGLK